MPGEETYILCSSNAIKDKYSIDNAPIWNFHIREYDLSNFDQKLAFEQRLEIDDFEMIESEIVKLRLQFYTISISRSGLSNANIGNISNIGMTTNIANIGNISITTKEFTFRKTTLGCYSPTSELRVEFAIPVKYFTIACNSRWCFGISLNENTAEVGGEKRTSQYSIFNNDQASDSRWYNRNASERLITACTILLPIPYLTAKVRSIYIRAADKHSSGYNIGKANKSMEVFITLNKPLRMPTLEVFILKDDFKLERLTWQKFLTLFDHNTVIYQRHTYIAEYGS